MILIFFYYFWDNDNFQKEIEENNEKSIFLNEFLIPNNNFFEFNEIKINIENNYNYYFINNEKNLNNEEIKFKKIKKKINLTKNKQIITLNKKEKNQNSYLILPPNTKLNENNIIECLEGFNNNNKTINWKGCWKCLKKCHLDAKCIYPGKCECNNNLDGDGINECIIPIPFLLNYEIIDFYSIYIEYLNLDFKPNIIYCKLNNYYSFSKKILNNSIIFYFNNQILKPFNLSISFNNLTWSNELIIKNNNKKINLIYIYILIILLIIYKTFLNNNLKKWEFNALNQF